MDINQLEDDSGSVGGINLERVLSDWTEAITNLYKNYSKLSAYIHKTSDQNGHSEKRAIYIGQCPTSHLVKLVSSMQVALEDLLNDISHPPNS
ncbi:hypothetical protein GO730_35545 [Spirosoma sp. HMF3257]|uniref:Uncharacterized protein n=1 Tax=Spirosoma telluris TaxID=2183553 RepID=A0A327NTN8_9BACT|nr:hypothetical protein [Spirosoma telluris]RAI78075.1 hypothetical protein HMF3257_35450 [Spirosoma telluris]